MIIGGYDFIDLRHSGERWSPIGIVDLIVLHHSVSDWDIRADNDRASIEAIWRYHTETLRWPGNGYHVAIGDDGKKYLVGDLSQQRAHLKYKNHRSWGIVLLGDYTHVEPPTAQIQGCAEAVVGLRRHANKPLMRWAGHKDVADPRATTACPGDQWPNYQDDLTLAVVQETVTMPEKTLTREQVINIIKADIQRTKELWQWIFSLKGWTWPDEM